MMRKNKIFLGQKKKIDIDRKIEYSSLAFLLFFLAFLTYSPHISYNYPLHIDEWHHISGAYKIAEGDSPGGGQGLRIGFQVLLAALSYFADLVSIYRFLPAIWAMITGIIIYFTTKRLTGKIETSIMTVIFYASLKSNINLLGTWFFVPLTFSIPLIYLYIYLLTSGIQEDKKSNIILSCIIMLCLVFIHAISLLFAVPIIMAYLAYNHRYVRKNLLVFIPFLLLPIAAVCFICILFKDGFFSLLGLISQYLMFSYGWGVAEFMNPITQVYPLVAIVLALIGFISIFSAYARKKYYFYLMWPIWMCVMLLVFYLFHISPFSPYQRNLYYLALSLPFLSAYGFGIVKDFLLRFRYRRVLTIILLVLVIVLSFYDYHTQPDDLAIYYIIDDDQYNDLKILEEYGPDRIMAPVWISAAIYPINRFEPIATPYWYGNESLVNEFYGTTNCSRMSEIIAKSDVSYVYSLHPIDCRWTHLIGFKNYVYHIPGR